MLPEKSLGHVGHASRLLLSCLSSLRHADPIPSAVVTVSDGMATVNYTPTGTETDDGGYNYQALGVMGNHWNVGFNLTGYSDPEVDAFIGVKNTSNVTKTYTVNSTFNVSPSLTGNFLTEGSVAGSLTDGNKNGATLTASPGIPIYQSFIDGVAYLPLLSAPQTFTSPATQTSQIPATSFGDLISSVPYSGSVNNQISILLTFVLSPGDTASFTSVFVVNQVVPEPASIALMGTGMLALVGIGWRRRRARMGR